MNADKCIKRIIDETRTQLTKEDVGNVVKMLLEYQVHPRNQKVFGPFSPEQGRVMADIEGATTGNLADARDMLIARAKLIAAQQEANVVVDAAKRAARQTTYAAAPDAYNGFKAKLVGTNHPFMGARDSAEAAISGTKATLLGDFDRELKAAHVDKLFAAGGKTFEKLWAKELFELNRDGGNPGVTRNTQALAVAQAIQNMQRRGVNLVNREGAFIGRYDGYITKTSHSSYRIGKMGVDAWVELAKQTFDIPMIYPNRTMDEIEQALKDQYGRIRTGMHDTYDPAEVDLLSYTPGQSRAKKASESRVIHFKDDAAWLRYMDEAGEITPTQAVFNSASSMARDAGLMRVWGTNPKAALDGDLKLAMQKMRDTGDHDGALALQAKRWEFDRWMTYLTGEANTVRNQTWAAITSNTLAVQRMAKLGFLPFAQLTDVSASVAELRYQGVDFMDRLTGGITAYFRGGLNSDKRKVADLLNAYVEGEMSDYAMQMELGDPQLSGTFTGRINQMQGLFFKYTGAAAMTNRARGSVMYMMARNMGLHHGEQWGAIGEQERRIMSMFNIGEHEWNALAQADWLTGLEGRRYLTPKDALTIPDTAAEHYNQATGSTYAYDEFKELMADRLYSYYADRMHYGVPNPTIEDRARLYRGYAADTPEGTALRLAGQFKQFALTMFSKVWGREIYGGQGAMGAAAGLVQFSAFGTILGILSNGLTQIAKGQDPTSQWEKHPFLAAGAGFMRAGSASMMGDFLFSDWSRHGQSLPGYVLGPTFGSIETFSRAYASMVRGEDPSGDLLQFARGVTPAVNLFYTKMATDYLIWNGLVEAAHPGYLKRAERKLKDTQGLEYFPGMSPNNLRAF